MVRPGVPGSVRVADLPAPVSGPREVLVRTLEVGICGTDADIVAGQHGAPPPGRPELVLGHESLGEVVQVGEAVSSCAPGDLVVATVRRPDGCPNCRHGESDMCSWGKYRERGIKELDGFLAECYAEVPEYLVVIPPALRSFAVLLEPLTVVEKAVFQAYKLQERLYWRPSRALVLGAGPVGLLGALLLRSRGLEVAVYDREDPGQAGPTLAVQAGATYLQAAGDELAKVAAGPYDLILEATGYSPLAFQAVEVLAPNGALALLSVTGGDRQLSLSVDRLNLELVLGNRVVFGSVNANRRYFEHGVADLERFEELWSGLAARLITRRLSMEDYAAGLAHREGQIKEVVVVAS